MITSWVLNFFINRWIRIADWVGILNIVLESKSFDIIIVNVHSEIQDLFTDWQLKVCICVKCTISKFKRFLTTFCLLPGYVKTSKVLHSSTSRRVSNTVFISMEARSDIDNFCILIINYFSSPILWAVIIRRSETLLISIRFYTTCYIKPITISCANINWSSG